MSISEVCLMQDVHLISNKEPNFCTNIYVNYIDNKKEKLCNIIVGL